VNRKNTILLAVFINAALLIVLFATALTTQEEIALAPTHEISKTSAPTQETPPMFGDELDFILRKDPGAIVETKPQAPFAETLPALPEAPPIVHSLPPVQSHAGEIASLTLPAARAESSSTSQEVSVKKGDTLEKIAKAHHTTVDEIIKLNHLPSSFLRIGQVLKVPPEHTHALKSAPAEKPVHSTGPDYYTVKVGDNPWMIAMKHHLKLDELLKLNGLNEEKARKLKPGDRLRIK
jgi:LysM repeat protein